MSKKIYREGFLKRKQNFAKFKEQLKNKAECKAVQGIIVKLDHAGHWRGPKPRLEQGDRDSLDQFQAEINKDIAQAIKNSSQKEIWEQLRKDSAAIINFLKEDIDRPATPASETPSLEIPAEEQKSESCAPTTTPGVSKFTQGIFYCEHTARSLPDLTYILKKWPPGPEAFDLVESCQLTLLYTWCHDKSVEAGVTLGTISLMAADGTTYGPWAASGKTQIAGGFFTSEQFEPGELWEATPNVVIPPGIYTVIDSDLERGLLHAAGVGIKCKFLAAN